MLFSEHIVDLNPKLDPIERKVSLDVLRCLITYAFNLDKSLITHNEITLKWLQNFLSNSEPHTLLNAINYQPPENWESFNKRPDLPLSAISFLLSCFDTILGSPHHIK